MSDIAYQAILPEGWERARGYSYGTVAAGSRIIAVAGQTGTEAGSDFGAQYTRALARVVEVMESAGGKAEHITAMRIYVTDMDAYRNAGAAMAEAWKASIGRHFPASTLVQVVALIRPEAMVEIEADGVLP